MIAIKQQIARLVEEAARAAQRQGLLPPMALPEALVEQPQNAEHGDLASTLPLKMARAARMNPLFIAQAIVDLMPPLVELEKVEAAAPGFINFTFSQDWLLSQIEEVLAGGDSYGDVDLGRGSRVQVEFVSANPTGPLHVGHGRGAVLGSTLANILEAAGYAVNREYYLNDTGNQIDAFARSLHARYLQALGQEAGMPSDGYYGEYMVELAQEMVAELGDSLADLPPEEAQAQLALLGMEKVVASIRRDLDRLGVGFDLWFSELSLYRDGQYDEAMAQLQQAGYLTEKEGALWFTTTSLGADKDNVVVRPNGVPTYFASDIAYHYDKFARRGFDRVINIWGADHHGHVSRVKAAAQALGIAPHRLDILISQMVTLKRGQEVLRLSKRSGDMVTLEEVLDEVGPDACRYFFLTRATSSQMDFDLELAKKQSAENPVYYIQYAHARIASILHYAAERGIDPAGGDVSLLTSEPEIALVRKLLSLPELVETMARGLEPHRLPHYALELATAFHDFYERCRVVSDDRALSAARLKLVMAAKLVLARTLGLMGMAAPEQM